MHKKPFNLFIYNLPAATDSHQPEATFHLQVRGVNTADEVSKSIRDDSSLPWVYWGNFAVLNTIAKKFLFNLVIATFCVLTLCSVWHLLFLKCNYDVSLHFLLYFSTKGFDMLSFSQRNTFSCISIQSNIFSLCVGAFSVSCCQDIWCDLTILYNSDKFEKTTLCIPFTSAGLGSSLTALTFPGSILSPCAVSRCPMWGTSCRHNTTSSAYSLMFFPCVCSGTVSHHRCLTTSVFHHHLESTRHMKLHQVLPLALESTSFDES